MTRKRRKSFATPELERIGAEMVARHPNDRGIGYRIAQVRAERDAENAA